MTEFDRVIRNAYCASTVDTFDSDIAIRDGAIVAPGRGQFLHCSLPTPAPPKLRYRANR